ncbi:MAG: hypothetical protein SFX18_16330 [Pirellulales bacterium]|nr:hypothetical protein [Pirellulales bacterium]
MQNLSFPGWLGPPVGTVAGLLIGLMINGTNINQELEPLSYLALTTTMGLLAGIFIWIVDRKSKPKVAGNDSLRGEFTTYDYPNHPDTSGEFNPYASPKILNVRADDPEIIITDEPSLVVKILAIFSLLLSWIPVAGLFLAILAYNANSKTEGWYKIACLIALAIGFLPFIILLMAVIPRIIS